MQPDEFAEDAVVPSETDGTPFPTEKPEEDE
jgi:hypothetical protein